MPGTPSPGPDRLEYVCAMVPVPPPSSGASGPTAAWKATFRGPSWVLVRNVKSLEVALYSAKTQFVEDLALSRCRRSHPVTLHREEEEQPGTVCFAPVFPGGSHVRN